MRDIKTTKIELKPEPNWEPPVIPPVTPWSEIYPDLYVCEPGKPWPEHVDVFIDRDEDGTETFIDIRALRPLAKQLEEQIMKREEYMKSQIEERIKEFQAATIELKKLLALQ